MFTTKSNQKISSYDVDDLILGHLEDLAVFEKNRIVDIEMVYEFFVYYIEKVHDNNEIQHYISSQVGEDIYQNFQYLYEKCKSYEDIRDSSYFIVFFWRWSWNIKVFVKSFTC